MNNPFKPTRIEADSIEFSWGYLAKGWGFEFMLNRGGYFDSNYSIDFGFIYGKINIKLPFKTKLGVGCNMPHYGIQIHNSTFWIHLGGKHDDSIGQCQDKWVTWDLPYFSYEFDKHEILNKDAWIDVGNELGFEVADRLKCTETYPYTYKLKSGEIQKRSATCFIERRSWHRKWFPFLKKIRESIDIRFNEEVGERSGSWKGGCTGCGYEILPDENILDCLRRMEKERKF